MSRLLVDIAFKPSCLLISCWLTSYHSTLTFHAAIFKTTGSNTAQDVLQTDSILVSKLLSNIKSIQMFADLRGTNTSAGSIDVVVVRHDGAQRQAAVERCC